MKENKSITRSKGLGVEGKLQLQFLSIGRTDIFAPGNSAFDLPISTYGQAYVFHVFVKYIHCKTYKLEFGLLCLSPPPRYSRGILQIIRICLAV